MYNGHWPTMLIPRLLPCSRSSSTVRGGPQVWFPVAGEPSAVRDLTLGVTVSGVFCTGDLSGEESGLVFLGEARGDKLALLKRLKSDWNAFIIMYACIWSTLLGISYSLILLILIDCNWKFCLVYFYAEQNFLKQVFFNTKCNKTKWLKRWLIRE